MNHFRAFLVGTFVALFVAVCIHCFGYGSQTGAYGTVGPGSGGAVTATNIPIGNTIYVDSVYGNDSTATVNNQAQPFLTLHGAITASSAGSTIILHSGIYSESRFLTQSSLVNRTISGEGKVTLQMNVFDGTGARWPTNIFFPFANGLTVNNIIFTNITGASLGSQIVGLSTNMVGATNCVFNNCSFWNTNYSDIFIANSNVFNVAFNNCFIYSGAKCVDYDPFNQPNSQFVGNYDIFDATLNPSVAGVEIPFNYAAGSNVLNNCILKYTSANNQNAGVVIEKAGSILLNNCVFSATNHVYDILVNGIGAASSFTLQGTSATISGSAWNNGDTNIFTLSPVTGNQSIPTYSAGNTGNGLNPGSWAGTYLNGDFHDNGSYYFTLSNNLAGGGAGSMETNLVLLPMGYGINPGPYTNVDPTALQGAVISNLWALSKVSATYIDIQSNTWSVFNATNALAFGATRLISSNRAAIVSMYNSGGGSFVSNYVAGVGGGILP